ncbi:hypothetical protein [Micromonospora sp. NPDC048898]|uniref:hypothetical protein n=1 Tax=Micromonospora sp. NPDC048898 TaxID=3364260 RepID=UPI003716362D
MLLRTAFVLGAGLSLAISDKMPLTDALGNLVRGRLPAAAARSPHGFKGGYFEAWLSRLAEPQPDLLDHENYSNHGLFLNVTDNIYTIVQECQLNVLAGQPDWWLQRLVGLMHTGLSDVITFNYDMLIEHTIEYLRPGQWPVGDIARAFRLVRDVPPFYRQPGFIVASSSDTFRLLKLHGSLDTFWVPGDSSGATIQRWELQGGWGDPQGVDEDRRRQALPGRSPFIVPPAAAKSAFYNNPVTRELWRSASEALRAADRVALIGYSLPPTDLVTSGMFIDTLRGTDTQVDVVNPCPDDIANRLINLGVPDGNVRRIKGTNPASDYTDLLEDEAARTITAKLSGTDPSRLLVVATSAYRAARVTGLRRNGDTVVLTIEPVTSLEATTRKQHHLTQEVVDTASLLGYLDDDSRVTVDYADGTRAAIITVGEWNTDTGLGDGHWTVLMPSAMPIPEPR